MNFFITFRINGSEWRTKISLGNKIEIILGSWIVRGKTKENMKREKLLLKQQNENVNSRERKKEKKNGMEHLFYNFQTTCMLVLLLSSVFYMRRKSVFQQFFPCFHCKISNLVVMSISSNFFCNRQESLFFKGDQSCASTAPTHNLVEARGRNLILILLRSSIPPKSANMKRWNFFVSNPAHPPHSRSRFRRVSLKFDKSPFVSRLYRNFADNFD